MFILSIITHTHTHTHTHSRQDKNKHILFSQFLKGIVFMKPDKRLRFIQIDDLQLNGMRTFMIKSYMSRLRDNINPNLEHHLSKHKKCTETHTI